MKEPTFEELLKAYSSAAASERIRCGRPGLRTVCGVLRTVQLILRECQIPESSPVATLTRRKLDSFLVRRLESGLSAASARSYMDHLRAITPSWARAYYSELGFSMIKFDIPAVFVPPRRYQRPSRDTLLKVRDWYESLEVRDDRRYWLAATLMLEFAMRNGDVSRLIWSQFITSTRTCLMYTPHKTALSSGRLVKWPVHQELWEKLQSARGSVQNYFGQEELVVPFAKEVFNKLNRELRTFGLFKGSKAIYELRKICIDHIYQRFGAEMASSISGDDIRTVMHYYADPSAPNLQNVRIIDLL